MSKNIFEKTSTLFLIVQHYFVESLKQRGQRQKMEFFVGRRYLN